MHDASTPASRRRSTSNNTAGIQSVPSVARRGLRTITQIRTAARNWSCARRKQALGAEGVQRASQQLPFCPAQQSYRGRGFNGIAKPGLLPPHIAADRSQFVDLHRFLRKLGFGNAGSKAKWDAEVPLLAEPLHAVSTSLLPLHALPDANGNTPASPSRLSDDVGMATAAMCLQSWRRTLTFLTRRATATTPPTTTILCQLALMAASVPLTRISTLRAHAT
eukprot:416567-Pleurochrysis_carterae.AAC.1